MVTQQELPEMTVPAGQVVEFSTAGRNSDGEPWYRNGITRRLLDNSQATVFLTIIDADGQTVLPLTPMAWTVAVPAPGTLPARFALETDATVLVPGAGPWLALYDWYGPGGLTDTHDGTVRRRVVEGD